MLCLSIMLPCLGVVSFAAEEMYTFFSADFEGEKIGAIPATGGELNQWNSKAASAESYTKVVKGNYGWSGYFQSGTTDYRLKKSLSV